MPIGNGNDKGQLAATSKGNSNCLSGKCIGITALLLTNLLVFQSTFSYMTYRSQAMLNIWNGDAHLNGPMDGQSSLGSSALEVPRGEAVALPSIRTAEKLERKFYGGKGDAKHLGGFTTYDGDGVSPAVWKYMIETLGVHSILDVGCGRGISTSWFALHGLDTLCVEGSHDAIERTMVPKELNPEKIIVEHDFARGPWWPSRTVDAVWCVEFLEHVGRNYQQNYIPAFRKAALIFTTHSKWGGWHHVEVHDDLWWKTKMESYGFLFSPELSNMIRDIGKAEINDGSVGPNGKPFRPVHVNMSMMVFINPSVASMPEHQHLFAEHGCYYNDDLKNVKCGEGVVKKDTTALPSEYLPLELTQKMDDAWLSLVKSDLQKE
mmetsp:Transcript_22327/g.34246  ORF Transcript_22327/g.34246 Transcript_22327/m.34246 type:complete len:377 (+) Transcript_22327:82-1212(+)|eukprot:CAMPEP_0196804362 /NCGR_PEP_ID=MMETSP1362-20130617/3966_1 /TAXON_ID=163516 /ORGANISM="Leptocylindrus danicus, Strain CCMP1856" /LENGTH=376 /DNA_ID=CAMNT_0042176619 /DNA_START=72 /DNA_END=1202 /DNA_ORIENTATION=-